MYNNFQILLLEDSESDVILAIREIDKIFVDYNLKVVDNEIEYMIALKSMNPDLIISDFMLPEFTGLAALKLTRKVLPFTPFVILTGSISEDTAVQCIKAGADDYVLKEHMMLLNPALENAIRKKKMEQEQKKASKSIEESERQYRALFENSPVPLWEEDFSMVKKEIDDLKNNGIKDFRKFFKDNQTIVDKLARSVKILEFNNAAIKLHKANSKEELKNGLQNIVYEGSFVAIAEQLVAISENRKNCELEGKVKTIDGELLDVRLNWLVVPGYEDTLERVYVSSIDISESKKFEKDLIKAKEDAEKGDRLKSTFLAQMSHEIRTPINAMLSLSSLLSDDLEEFADEDQKLSFNLVRKAGDRIVRTVDLLLNLSEIQAGTYEPILKQIDLYSDILSNLVVKFKRVAKEKNININLKIVTPDCELVADSYTVNQIFEQLLDNSIKYTNSGKVDITIMRQGDKLCVEVSDTGIGILKEYLPHLFDSFSQEESGYSRKYEGSGIGLALVKYYCEINNASITVDSEKNIGSKFKVVFNNC